MPCQLLQHAVTILRQSQQGFRVRNHVDIPRVRQVISNFSHSAFTVATCSFVDPDRCIKYNGRCKRNCATDEKQVDVCFSPSKICCTERLYEEDGLF
ncbi:beta-defensin 114 [Loxodonta africana]|uniref:beta-defensin 114 n=1 Tax=Loxodonta africana TaxID=9785 RepID=UPI000C811A5F|nr:beta-defensin 114 [Loxodonta africana]